MSLRTVLSLSAILSVLFGLGFALAPAPTVAAYGFGDPTPGHLYAARWFGVYLIGAGTINWLARAAGPSDARRAIVGGNLVVAAAGLALGLAGVLQGTVNAFGWSTVVIYVALGGLLARHASGREAASMAAGRA